MGGGGQKKKAHERTGFGAIKAGDGGKRFREEWLEVDEENWKWMAEEGIDPQTGKRGVSAGAEEKVEGLEAEQNGQKKSGLGARAVQQVEQSWFARNKMYIVGGVIFAYIAAARLMKENQEY